MKKIIILAILFMNMHIYSNSINISTDRLEFNIDMVPNIYITPGYQGRYYAPFEGDATESTDIFSLRLAFLLKNAASTSFLLGTEPYIRLTENDPDDDFDFYWLVLTLEIDHKLNDLLGIYMRMKPLGLKLTPENEHFEFDSNALSLGFKLHF